MIERPRSLRRVPEALLSLVLLVLPWLLYPEALGLWWTEDDFFQLRYALEHSPREYFLDPGVWRRLPNRVLSPLLFVSYDLDLALWGLSSQAFYAHQLVSIGLAGAALFLVLRLWLSVEWAFLGAALFLLGPPVASLAPLLMVRHYPEAVFLILLSMGAFVLAARRREGRTAFLAVLSALFYLAAATAKEIALPLPLVLALLPETRVRRRLLLLVPHAVGAAFYSVYRTWMLGTPIGGYGWTIRPGDWPTVLYTVPGKVARELAGPSGWGWVALVALIVPVVFVAARKRSARVLVAGGLLFAWLPILPVVIEMTPRLATTSWLVLTAAFALAVRQLVVQSAGRAAVAILVGIACSTAFVGNRAAWDDHLGAAKRKTTEALGYLELGEGGFLRHPTGTPASMAELGRFARTILERPARGGWFYDDLFLCSGSRADRHRGRPRIETLWTFDPESEGLIEITSKLPTLRRRHCSSIHWQAALEASFSPREGGALEWTLGPFRDGRYAFVMEDGRLQYEVPREGGFRLGSREELTLRVRYDSPAGWVTYSPPLSIEMEPKSISRWRRAGP